MPDSDRIKIYYLASGKISIPILSGLLNAPRLELVGIGSQLRSSKHKGGPVRTIQGPIVTYCEEHGIAVERYASVNTPEFLDRLRDLGAEMLVVASFGQILKQPLLELLPYGCLNVHASLLPRYRGASPIMAAMLDGEAKTGVTFMRMEAGLDTGPMYRSCELDILPEDNKDTLEERLGELAGGAIEQVIVDIVRNGLEPVPQPEDGASYAGKVTKEDGVADWSKTAVQLANMTRAFNPWPSLKTMLPTRSGKPKMVKITSSTPVESFVNGARPGEILAFGKEGIVIACGEGSLRINRLTPEGKKDMPAKDYLLGTPIPPDSPFVCDFEGR